MYRYNVTAHSDEVVLNQKALPNRSPFVGRSAGNALRQLAQDLLPGWFDTSAVQDIDTLATYVVNPQRDFSFHAAEIALAARASVRTMNGALILAPVGATTYALNESDANFSPAGLWLDSPNLLVNELTVIGQEEPQAYVRDYFVGDGLSLKFYMSQKPFAQPRPALIDERYAGPNLDPTMWVANDPSSAARGCELHGVIAGRTRRVVRRRNIGGGMFGGISDHPIGYRIDDSSADQWSAYRPGNCHHAGTSVFLHDLLVLHGGLPPRGDLSLLPASSRDRMGRRGRDRGRALRVGGARHRSEQSRVGGSAGDGVA